MTVTVSSSDNVWNTINDVLEIFTTGMHLKLTGTYMGSTPAVTLRPVKEV